MHVTAREEDGILVVSVNEDRIDAAAAIQFKDAMREVTANGTGRVVLDLAQVVFIDSSGLGAIVAVMKELGDDRRLELAAMQTNVDRVFRLTRMDSVFPVHAGVDDALRTHAG
ncbi:STAS domain-containing protein [Pseudooceanicola sp. LIPI14-2-Ac024]|uniref:STAS domain-containing protein n=1 Tax=Pseudooceanicola sp. LIPI14-2-Ac024 TaxID=3344875 RepID=UPI0035CF49A2